jgi:PAS domain S-box-containing protein
MSAELTGKLRGLLDFATRLVFVSGLEQLAGAVLGEYLRLTGAQGGSFYSREESTFVLRGCLDPGHAPQTLGFPFRPRSALERAQKLREALSIREFGKDLAASGWREYRDTSALVFPLLGPEGEMNGVVSLHDPMSPPFGPDDLELGGVLASLTSSAIESLRTAAALRESEQRYREVFEHSHGGIVLLDVTEELGFRVATLNPAVERMTGLLSGQVRGRFVDEILPGDTGARLIENYRTCVTMRTPMTFDQEAEFPSGRRSVHTTLIPVCDQQGRIRRLIALPVDTTGQSRAEEALRGSEQRFREVFENSSDGIFLLDVGDDGDFTILELNPAEEKRLGVSSSQARGKRNDELMPRDAADHLDENNRRCLEAGVPITFDDVVELPTGRYEYHTTLSPVRDETGRVYRIVGVSRDVTQIRVTERALRQSEEKFSRAFHASPDSITISRLSDGVILEANRGFVEANGYSREEAIGRSSLPGGLDLWVDPEERDAWAGRLRKDGEVFGFEARFRRRDGTVRYGLLSSRTLELDGEKCLLTISRDMTDRRRMEEAVRESEARYREIFENTSDGIFVVEVTPDQRFRLVSYNPAQERMLGIRAVDAVGKFNDEYLPREFAERVNEDNRRCIQAGRPMSFEQALDLPGGRVYYSTMLVPVRDGTGRVARLIGVTRDFTERRRAEEREREHEQELFQAAKLVSLGTLVSGVAHEIKNPNNFIRLNSQNLKELWRDMRSILGQAAEKEGDLAIRGIPYDEVRDMVDDLLAGIEEGSKRIEKLVVNLRDFARGDEGDLTDDVDVNTVINSAVMMAGNLIRGSTDAFSVREARGLPPVRGNYHQIEQVLINLVTNACQSLPSRERAVAVSTFAEHDWVCIEVEDEGIGIPPQDIPRVTDPFFTTKRARGGSGLGLAVSFRIVSNHGGTMSFTSQVDKGTRVTVRLPARAQ